MMENQFGECLREARVAMGLSQFELAMKTRICPKSINLYERGKTIPRPGRIKILARALRKPVSYFLVEKRPGARIESSAGSGKKKMTG